MTIILRCRIDESCDAVARFPHIQAVNASDWSEISPFSITNRAGREMRGYCPSHGRD